MSNFAQPPSSASQSSGLMLAWSRGKRNRSIRLSAPAVVAASVFVTAACVLAPCAAAYLAFHDDLLADLLDRQTEMRYAYEDRLAALRLRLDQVTSRQYIDQDGVEGEVQKLAIRQAQLETRAAAVAQLVDAVASGDAAMLVPKGRRAAAATQASAASDARASFDMDAPVPLATAKPEPDGMVLRLGDESGDADSASSPTKKTDRKDEPIHGAAAALQLSAPHHEERSEVAERLHRLAYSLDRFERDQTARVARLVRPTQEAAARLRRAFDIAGLPVEHYVAGSKTPADAPTGGPYVAADYAPGAHLFERELAAAQTAASTLDGLRRALPSVPLRKPLTGEIETTSTFGYRTDPFLGRPALHTGVDLRDDYGAPVRATAAGVVTAAGPNGGYGYMVEIDHGDGLGTRYAHLSAISVAAGQRTPAGSVVGLVGSTGRSTGPHLHYEVRMSGEPVDPSRFLRAATTLSDIRQ